MQAVHVSHWCFLMHVVLSGQPISDAFKPFRAALTHAISESGALRGGSEL
jgi:hypothetical protein